MKVSQQFMVKNKIFKNSRRPLIQQVTMVVMNCFKECVKLTIAHPINNVQE